MEVWAVAAMIDFPRFWDASFPIRPFYRPDPRKAVPQSTGLRSERALCELPPGGILCCMERASAGEGNSPSTPLEQPDELTHRSDRDERCAYGRLVARELEALRQSDGDTAETQPLRARIRRWCGWPLHGGSIPAASRAEADLWRIPAPRGTI
jgi:hypothetical protein